MRLLTHAALLCAALVVVACGTARGPKAARPHGSCEFDVPEDACSAVRDSVALGLEIYRHDKVAAVATDALAAKVGDLTALGRGGWITARKSDDRGEPSGAWTTLFFHLDEEKQSTLTWRVTLVPRPGDQPVVEQLQPPHDPPGFLRTAILARQNALAALPAGHPRINPVILPGQDARRAILVYLLAAETRPDEIVLGIHYRVLMSEDGQRVLEMAPLSRAPIVIPLAEGGKNAEAIWVTNILTDYPMEQHVFASLLHHGLPIYVSTARGLWEVRGPEVRYVGER